MGALQALAFSYCPDSKPYFGELSLPEEARQGPEEGMQGSVTMSLQEFTSAEHTQEAAFPGISHQERGAVEVGTGEVFGK